MTEQWGDWFAGTGARPEGVADDDELKCEFTTGDIQYCSVKHVNWHPATKYALRADHPYYGPPLWALDEAARRCEFRSWAWIDSRCGTWTVAAIRELAKEIALIPPPPDPDAREREECARLLDACHLPSRAYWMRQGKGSDNDAMITELRTILKERGL